MTSATNTGFSTTLESLAGDPLDPATIPMLGWTVCAQMPAAGTATSSNDIILNIGNSAAGEQCDGTTATPTPTSPGTITYIVSGSRTADVQYGPAGSSDQGHVPMSITNPLAHPIYYSITAQLQGDGHVTCKLEVDGTVISTATASGGYNIATCEISQDPITGDWKDTNSG